MSHVMNSNLYLVWLSGCMTHATAHIYRVCLAWDVVGIVTCGVSSELCIPGDAWFLCHMCAHIYEGYRSYDECCIIRGTALRAGGLRYDTVCSLNHSVNYSCIVLCVP